MHEVSAGDPAAMRNYTQFYTYDPLGNITRMRHQASGNNWTRDYNYAAGNNRMLSTIQGMQVYHYGYHPQHGFINAMPHLEDLGWNFKEKLVRSVRQKVLSGTPETTYYQYSADGTRLRKITENAAPAAPGTHAKGRTGLYRRVRTLSQVHGQSRRPGAPRPECPRRRRPDGADRNTQRRERRYRPAARAVSAGQPSELGQPGSG